MVAPAVDPSRVASWRNGGHVGPHLGRILLTSSVSARVAMGGRIHYSAAKAGVNAFIRGAAFEHARDGITVNAVEAGFIATLPETGFAVEQQWRGE